MDEVFWIQGKNAPPLAIVLCPLGDRDLAANLRRYKAAGLETIVSMLEPHEAGFLGLAEEEQEAARAGLHFLSYPIQDTQIPRDIKSFRRLVAGLAERLKKSERIGIHCRGSIGRSTVAAACTLIHLGWSPQTALTAIESARGMTVPDTPEQEAWILRYKAEP